jgi:hypothetical protein
VACQVAAGERVSIDGPVATTGVGFWLMVQPPMAARRVRSVAGVEEIGALEGVDSVSLRCGPGEPVDWRDGTDSQVLTVRGYATDHQALAGRIAEIRSLLAIDYDEEERAVPASIAGAASSGRP